MRDIVNVTSYKSMKLNMRKGGGFESASESFFEFTPAMRFESALWQVVGQNKVHHLSDTTLTFNHIYFTE